MGVKIFVLLGILILCVGAPADDTPPSTSTSYSVSTVTRKVTSKSVSRIHHQTESGSEVTEKAAAVAQDEEKSLPNLSLDDGDGVTKPQKLKKKILVSNLKNSTDKVVLANDKNEKHLIKPVVVGGGGMDGSDGKDGEKPVSSGSAEDDVMEEVLVKSENGTEEVVRNKTWSESDHKTGMKRKEGGSGAVEGRSLEDRSSEENVNVNTKAKTKSPAERTTSSYTYENYGEIQKVLNNNYLNNNEGYEHRSGSKNVRPSPPVILPGKKSTPVSGDNSLKNAIRFESEYYGPTGQTDWVPIIPDKLPVRSPASGSQEFGNKLRTERLNKTSERNVIVFPSDGGVQPSRENNVVVVQGTTSSHRNTVEKPVRIASNSEDSKQSTSQSQPIRTPIKFRGAVKYKSSNQSNLTLDERRFPNKTLLKGSNSSTESPETESSRATWTLATLGGPAPTKPTARPVREDATEISVFTVVSTTNSTKKSQNGVDSGLAVPPQNVKVDNMTKKHQKEFKNSESSISNVNSGGGSHNESVITNNMPKLADPKEASPSAKTIKSGEKVNETYVIIPGSVDINQSNKSVPVVEVTKASTLEPETTSVEITTEDSSTVESVQEMTNFEKTTNAITENSSISSQSNVATNSSEYFTEQPVTTPQTKGSVVATMEEETATTFGKVASTDKTSLSSSIEETNEETTTEVESTTVKTTEEETANESVSGGIESTEGFQVSNSTVMTSVRNDTTGLSSSVYIDVNNTTTTTTPAFVLSSVNTTPPPPPPAPTSVVNATTGMPVTWFTTVSTTTELTKAGNLTTTTTTTVPIISVNFTTVTSPTTTTAIPTTNFTTSPSVVTHIVPPLNITTTQSTTKLTTVKPTTAATTTSTTQATTQTTSTPSTKLENEESKPETTEESIYYKNYIPTTANPRDEITEENVPAYLRLTVQASSWEELCRLKEDLRDAIIKMLGGKNVSYDSVHFLNLNERNCQEKIEETKGEQTNGTIFLPVNMFLMDKNGDFDKNLSEAFLTLWGRRGLDFELPIRKVDFVTPIVNLTELADPPLGGSVVAAIVISCVAGICVILLGILFVIMKRRQKRFNYGQRCTPVSLDAYSLDSVSIYNSVRRKGIRASKRSYGNAAFDDPEVPTHPMNFAGLANFSSDKDQLYEEFNIIPQVYPKADELPAGAETKNRYANIIPLPETRVHLTVKDGDALSDYINANYVRGLKGAEKLYIACQAPMESTLEDFWRMIWEQQCKVILMLTDLQENGIEKCADYLPPNEVTDNLRLFGDYQVTLKKRDVKEKYIISHLVLKNMETNLWREITHLWYLGWPDQGVPSEVNSLIAFLIEARSQTKIQNGATTSSPTVVHCSPGTGRTGTVIACDLCIREYEQTRMVDIPKCVFNLRRDRAGSVQTKDQYAFIYQVLNVYATKLSGGGIESI